jgi:glycosyltransferase involved in cell wall biosynthesis
MALSLAPTIVRYWTSSGRLVRFFQDVRMSDHFDAVWVDRTYFGEVARRAGFTRLVVDVDDIQTTFFSRDLLHSAWYRSKMFHIPEVVKLFCYERSATRRFWRLVVCKETDRHFFGSPRKVFVVPNGVPTYPTASPEVERSGELLYVGAMHYPPNIDAATYFYRLIFPQVQESFAGACFQVVGKDPDPEVAALHDGKTCFVHGTVPQVAPHYETASVVVAPIRQGSGTRLKVLEALARGKAVVATTTAAEGLDVRPGIDLEITDDVAEFARICVRLLRDPEKRRRLGQAGRKRVLERYSWERVGRVAERVLAAAGRLRDLKPTAGCCVAGVNGNGDVEATHRPVCAGEEPGAELKRDLSLWPALR